MIFKKVTFNSSIYNYYTCFHVTNRESNLFIMGVGSEQAQDCGKCGLSISGKAMKVKDRAYHEEKCFSCTECRRDLKAIPVYSRNDQLYCEKDYREKFVPKCAHCNDYVLDVRITLKSFLNDYLISIATLLKKIMW